jgi:hypothetical protein
LVANVVTKLTGNQTMGLSGYRPVGVPYSVMPVTPIYATVNVTGTLLQYIQAASVETNIETSTQSYFAAQGISGTVSQSSLSASVSNAGEGYFTALDVELYISSGGGPVASITADYSQRVILQSLDQAITTQGAT